MLLVQEHITASLHVFTRCTNIEQKDYFEDIYYVYLLCVLILCTYPALTYVDCMLHLKFTSFAQI